MMYSRRLKEMNGKRKESKYNGKLEERDIQKERLKEVNCKGVKT